MVDGQGQAGLVVSVEECVFFTKAYSNSCKSEPTLNSAGISPLSPLIYVRYKDHVIYKNIQQPIAEAVERETVGWLTNQNDEIMLIEHDRSLRVKGCGVNGVVLLKSCILEIRLLPLQKISNWPLNSPETKQTGEYALKPKKRKTTKNQQSGANDLQAVTITHSPLGKKLKKAIDLQLPETQSLAEEKLRQYVINSLCWKMPSLVLFTLNNSSTLEVAKHLLRHRTGSSGTLYQYVYGIHRFSKWLNIQPDQLIQKCQDQDGDPNPKAIAKFSRLLDDFVGELQAEELAPGTVSNHVKGVKALFRASNLKLELAYSLPKRSIYKDRSPTSEELALLIDLAEIRVKTIISMLSLGGFRSGTLVKLQYRLVKRDLEKGVVPIHVHVEAEITKGKYHDYDTFLGQEAAEYLRLYLLMRRQGTDKIPPENIHDETPLIRNMQLRRPVPITTAAVHKLVHELYQKAGLIPQKSLGRRYDLRVHSIRKFFRTQLAALGMPTDYIEYMMGHTISTYHDIEMKGIEYLRGIYSASALSIRPKTKVSKIDALKEIIRAWGLNPDEILTKDALTRPNATIISRDQLEERQLHQLGVALKQELLKEIREEKHATTNQ